MDKITIHLAVYGAILSTFVLLWDVIKYFKDKPSLRVTANYHGLIGPLKKEVKIGIEIVNAGRRPVTLVSTGFELDTDSDENIITVLDPNLPRELSEGQRYITYTNPKEFDSGKILFARARDATGRVYRSKKNPLAVAKK